MNKPRNRGAKLDANRFSRWTSQFSGYRNPVTAGMIELWLDQFAAEHRDLAARLLDSVLFITHQHIHTSFRELLNGIEGWNKSAAQRRGKWCFVPFSGSAGESGDSMSHALRMATSMNHKRYHDLFIHRSDLVTAKLGPDDTVVLIDDFSGTGNQASQSWRDVFAELLTGGPRIILLLVAATRSALQRIVDETDMEPLCGTTLRTKDNLFHPDCSHFSLAEKETLLSYCKRASRREPKGYGDSGLVLIFAHQCPNNTIPMLHACHNRWQGLFPRHT